MQEMITDQLIRDGRVETQELKINVNKGWIYLEGLSPSQAKHEILISIIQDVLGFKNIVDSIRIDRQLWEQQRYAPGTEKKEITEKEKKWKVRGAKQMSGFQDRMEHLWIRRIIWIPKFRNLNKEMI
jgi:hypothetical protein